jgi:hypothetical protein
MSRNIYSVKYNPLNLKKASFPESFSKSNLYENFLIKNLEDNKGIKLDSEIKDKKYKISSMFRKKLGRDFLSVKPDSLIIFQKLFGEYLFNPESAFLANFPKLQRRLRHERKISEMKLKDKIDIGGMLLYDLNKKAKNDKHIVIAKEKMLSFSKNFLATPTKDVVEKEYYKTKFWDKNSIKLERYFKKKLLNNLIQEVNEEEGAESDDIDSQSNLSEEKEVEDSSDKSSVNISIVKENSPRKKENSKQYQNPITLKKLSDFDSEIKNRKNENSLKQKNDKKSISSYKNQYNNINSITAGNIKTKNISRNINNFSDIFGKTNPFKKGSYNISQSKINSSINSNSIALNTVTNFNFSNSKGLLSKSNKLKKYSPGRNLLKKKVSTSLIKNKEYKYKLGSNISKLNDYTNKCNIELIKLIDINNDDNYKERKKKILNRNKLDIKEILSEKKELKKIDSEEENAEEESPDEPEIKDIEKDTVKSLIREARINIKERLGKLIPRNKEKIFKKKIMQISDEQALAMADNFIKKKKELDVRKILATESKLKKRKEKEITLMRLKTKKNYKKMVKLKNQLIIEKGRINKAFEDFKDINSNNIS